MYLLFLDEAGSPGEPEFILGGVAVDAGRWHQLRDRWVAVAGAHGRPADAEVKWFKLKRSGQLAGQLADVLVESGVTSFAVELHTTQGRAVAGDLFASPNDIYATALMFIAERFQRFLEHQQDYGAIIVDQREGSQDERLRRFFRRLVDNGTPYTKLERILDPVLLSPSHHTMGIQAADLVVGSMLAMGRAHASPALAERAAIARQVHERLLPSFARNPNTGSVEGVGIKRFPDASTADADHGKLFELSTTEETEGSVR